MKERTVEKREHECKESPYLVLKNGFNKGRRYNIRGLSCLLNGGRIEVTEDGKARANGLIYTLNEEILEDLAGYHQQRNIQRDEYLKNHELLEQKV